MTEQELSEIESIYVDDRISTHYENCHLVRLFHTGCCVAKLVAEVRRLRGELTQAINDYNLCERENDNYQLEVQKLADANAAFQVVANRQKAEIAEWTNAARKVFKGPLQFTDAADFDRQQEEREKEGMAALNDLMLGNGWANVESESTLAHMAREVESRGAEIKRLREELATLERAANSWGIHDL